ncbi:MAG TPA: hypothetical protein VLX28_20540 [Thermoanaerobaculia bacterium]|nr:hypothetical protein [Thermoanaerobaculia bacterium]
MAMKNLSNRASAALIAAPKAPSATLAEKTPHSTFFTGGLKMSQLRYSLKIPSTTRPAPIARSTTVVATDSDSSLILLFRKPVFTDTEF